MSLLAGISKHLSNAYKRVQLYTTVDDWISSNNHMHALNKCEEKVSQATPSHTLVSGHI